MSSPNPALVAAAPSLSASLTALSTFLTNLGADPTKIPATFPGAVNVLLGTLELQLPAVVNAEFSVLVAEAQSKIATLQQRLAAAVAPAAAPTTSSSAATSFPTTETKGISG